MEIQNITIQCFNCHQKFERLVSELKNKPMVVCPHCRSVFRVDPAELFMAQEDLDRQELEKDH